MGWWEAPVNNWADVWKLSKRCAGIGDLYKLVFEGNPYKLGWYRSRVRVGLAQAACNRWAGIWNPVIVGNL